MFCRAMIRSAVTGGTVVAASSIAFRHHRTFRAEELSSASALSQICFIRHGESTVNARGKQYRERGLDPGRAYHEAEFLDAPLTSEGRDGAAGHVRDELRQWLSSQKDSKVVRLVITSTLRRALETATHGVLPVLPPDDRTHWVALESVREATACEVRTADGKYVPTDVFEEKPCNFRRSLNCARQEFPHVNFSSCVEEDPLCRLETIEAVDKRVMEFAGWLQLWADQQKKQHGDVCLEVVVVSHYVFLHRLLERIRGPEASSATPYGLNNCEVRKFSLQSVIDLAAE